MYGETLVLTSLTKVCAELILSLTELLGNESVSDLMKLPPDAKALPLILFDLEEPREGLLLL